MRRGFEDEKSTVNFDCWSDLLQQNDGDGRRGGKELEGHCRRNASGCVNRVSVEYQMETVAHLTPDALPVVQVVQICGLVMPALS